MGAGGTGEHGVRVPLFVAQVTNTDTDSATLLRHSIAEMNVLGTSTRAIHVMARLVLVRC